MTSRVDSRKFKSMNRRELLKLAPVVALGTFAIPQLQKPLLKAGLGFSDWASARLFRSGHLATTFSDSELTPFNKFPINGYDVDDPGVDFDRWTLTVSGAVQRPGDYTLAQIQALPKVRQNTRHVCVEGWDVIGRFGGARLSDFLKLIGADPSARFLTVECADDYYESLDMATALHPQTLLCYAAFGFNTHMQGGANYDLWKFFSVGASGYAILPSGQQTIFSKVQAGKSSGHGHAFENNQQTTGTADLARDHGFSAWVDANPAPYLDMELGYTRSVNYDLNAISFGIGINVGYLARRNRGY